MKIFSAAATVLVGGYLLMPFASAHHATAVQYETSATITLKGTITRVDWANPHTHIYMDVKSENASQETWMLEFPSPGAIVVTGLSRQLLAPGTVLTLEGYPSKPIP